jgi:hypothetical protein
MTRWFRVFGNSNAEPDPAALLDPLHALGLPVQADFRRDDLGWFRAGLSWEDRSVEVERYLASEPDIRGELNTWAAWLETMEHNPHHGPLMERMIGTQQLFTLRASSKRADPEAEQVCRTASQLLARVTDGVYQVDGEGFFDQVGKLLVSEE